CFFQAEDGIRDRNVTGVQTCALPICPVPAPGGASPPHRRRGWRGWGTQLTPQQLIDSDDPALRVADQAEVSPRPAADRRCGGGQIGRASCRERGGTWGSDVCQDGYRR